MIPHSSQSAEATFRLFGIDIYLQQATPCAAIGQKEISMTVSPFREQVPLGDIISELARRAAEAKAKIIYDVRLLSFTPSQGAVVKAITATCLGSEGNPVQADLLKIIESASTMRVFAFLDADAQPIRTIRAATIRELRLSTGSSAHDLKVLISSPETFQVTSGLKKSCPFLPTYGFELISNTKSAWWLISEPCQTAMLTTEEQDWRKQDVINLQPNSLNLFRRLVSSGDSR